MLTRGGINVALDEAKVYYAYSMQCEFVIWLVTALADEYVVKLEVVVGVACLVDQTDLLDEAKAYLDGARQAEWLVALKEIFL